MKSNLYKKLHNKALTVGALVFIILISIILIVSLITYSNVFESSSEIRNERTCLQFLNSLDRLTRTQNVATIRTLIDDSCGVREKNILNERQLLQEIRVCNSRAQNVNSQELFIEQRITFCMICSEINSNSNIELNTNSLLPEEQLNIQPTTLSINSDSYNILYFTIEESNISFNIENNENTNPCSKILNS